MVGSRLADLRESTLKTALARAKTFPGGDLAGSARKILSDDTKLKTRVVDAPMCSDCSRGARQRRHFGCNLSRFFPP